MTAGQTIQTQTISGTRSALGAQLVTALIMGSLGIGLSTLDHNKARQSTDEQKHRYSHKLEVRNFAFGKSGLTQAHSYLSESFVDHRVMLEATALSIFKNIVSESLDLDTISNDALYENIDSLYL